ncbi:MAG: glutamyl-tRNA reductase [Candidatus Omnitrophica bacterium]|nr:glutamyl-tRNA reductase [Candidatus Omnitrophota bacterium]
MSFQETQIPEALQKIRREFGIAECVILSTCNRVELYTLFPAAADIEGGLRNFMALFHQVDPVLLRQSSYWYRQPDSVRHLFRVAAGLDSMVMGESEILGQVREAYRMAVSCGSVGGIFHRFFQTALHAGKEVRSKTRIGQGAVSVSSVAVDLAGRIFSDLKRKTVLNIGAGQMAEATLDCLKKRGAASIRVANRTLEAAARLAESVGGQPVSLNDLEFHLAHADIVICSTAADRFLISPAQVRGVMHARRQRPLFLIDISVPRNVDPLVGQMENVYLYDIDDLQGIASANLKIRLNESEACSAIIEAKADEFLNRALLYNSEVVV